MMKLWLPWTLKIGLSVGLIVWVLSQVDLSAAWRQASAISPAMLLAALGLMLAHMVLGTGRWLMVLRGLSTRITWGQGFLYFYIGVFFSTVLPGPIAGDAVRIWYSYKTGLALRAAVNSVLLERAVTVYALVLLVCATQPLLQQRVQDLPGMWMFIASLGACTLGIAVLAVLDQLPFSSMHLRVVRGLVALSADTRSFFFRSPWSLATVAVAMAGHANLSLAVYLLAAGIGLDVGIVDCLVLVPPVILIMTLPISIAGWGVRETAMVTAFGFVGVSAESALALSVVFGILIMVIALPGGLMFLLTGVKPGVIPMDDPKVVA